MYDGTDRKKQIEAIHQLAAEVFDSQAVTVKRAMYWRRLPWDYWRDLCKEADERGEKPSWWTQGDTNRLHNLLRQKVLEEEVRLEAVDG